VDQILVIGLKELTFEILKSPLSAIDSGWIGPAVERRNPLSPVCFRRAALGFWEDWRDGFTAFSWRFLVRSRHTPVDLARDLLGAAPVAGAWFGHHSPPDSAAPPPATALIVLSQGIHAGTDGEQFTAAWRRALGELRPGVEVVGAPYRGGGLFDTFSSMLNLSHGSGYDLAARAVFDGGLRPGDGVELVGFSGGVQRAVAASRALRIADITVNRLVGVAGPAAGFSTAIESHLLLGDDPIADPVLLSARAFRILFPLFPSNLRVETVPGAGGHHLPFLPHPSTRAPRRGYAAALQALTRP
jgi:hypothetical protein